MSNSNTKTKSNSVQGAPLLIYTRNPKAAIILGTTEIDIYAFFYDPLASLIFGISCILRMGYFITQDNEFYSSWTWTTQ